MYAGERGGKWLFLAGFLAGIATLTDYLALIPTVCLGALVLWRERTRVWRFIIGGVPAALALFSYNQICFGSPFTISTRYTNPLFVSQGDSLGMFGVPSPGIFLELLLGVQRGMLLATPVFFLAIPGFIYLRRKSPVFAWTLLAGVITALLVNSAFNGWDGGNTAFARYQIVLLPFWMLLVAAIPAGRIWRWALLLLACLSLFNMAAVVSVCSQPMRYDENPIYGTAYRHFFRGEFDIQTYPIRLQKFNPDWPKFARLTSWNAGELILGLRGWWSLLPLAAVFYALSFFIFRRSSPSPSPDTDPEAFEKAKRVLDKERVAVFIVAYNAEETVESVLRRIPDWVAVKLAEVYVIDDSSTDGTVAKLRSVPLSGTEIPFKIFKTPYNLGYGGNQKMGYSYAVKQGFDIVVLLHGDGQYAPEFLPAILAEYDDPANSAVFGSRFAAGCAPLRGGMPLYKWIGNRILTKIQNLLAGSGLSEMHSGYRSYRVDCLKRLPFEKNSDDFHFDAEIILQHIKAGLKIREVPISTFYGDEICYVNGIQYAWNCLKTAVKFRLMGYGVFFDPKFDVDIGNSTVYTSKAAETSLHYYLRNVNVKPGSFIVDIGGGDGSAVAKYFAASNRVYCVDAKATDFKKPDGVKRISFDLDGDWSSIGDGDFFDVVFALDVIEHLSSPEDAASKLFDILASGGVLYASTANIAYFIPRIMLALGNFNYGKKGILDLTHKRLFTVATFRRLLENSGFRVERIVGFGPPLKDLRPDSRLFAIADFAAAKLARLWPTLFAFNFLIICERPDGVDDLTRKTFSVDNGKSGNSSV